MSQVNLNLSPSQADQYNLPETMAFRSAFACLNVAGNILSATPARDYWETEAKVFTLENAHRYFDLFWS